MKRRSYLTGAVSVFTVTAGCMASGTKNIEDSPMKEVTSVSVSGLESTNVGVEASVHQSEITPEQTAEVSFTITWNGEERQKLTFGSSIPFSSPKKSADPRGLLLIDDETGFERRDNETWVPKIDDIRTGNLNLMMALLEPGEGVSQTWEVWADPGEASRIEPGMYTFNDSIKLQDSEQVEWSLTVEVEEQ